MTPHDNPDYDTLQQRLAAFQGENTVDAVKRRSQPSAVKMAALLGGAAVIAGMVYLASQYDDDDGMAIRQASEFQTEGSGFGDLARPTRSEPEIIAEETPPAPVDDDDSELLDLVRSLQAQIDGLNTSSETPVTDGTTDSDSAALTDLRAEFAALRDEATARERDYQDAISSRDLEIAGMANEMDMLRLQGGQSSTPTGEDMALSQLRDSAEAAAQLEQQRITSSMIAIGGGGAASGAAGAVGDMLSGDGLAAQQAAKLSDDAAFVRNAGRPVQVQRAEIIVNPSNTVTQGTMIQAVLETAIDSTLEGPIRGQVTTDVVAYDGSRVLIPRGSKLIGSYSSDLDAGQSRLLVAWERIIMPDNQSVQIGAFGGDALGRSGTTGKVNNHFLKRFGSAALISTIAAIPSMFEDSDSGGGVTISGGGADAASGISDALGGATDAAIGKYVNMPPTITVPQGARITVMVDRDLEVF